MIASEPLTFEQRDWMEVKNNTMVVITPKVSEMRCTRSAMQRSVHYYQKPRSFYKLTFVCPSWRLDERPPDTHHGRILGTSRGGQQSDDRLRGRAGVWAWFHEDRYAG